MPEDEKKPETKEEKRARMVREAREKDEVEDLTKEHSGKKNQRSLPIIPTDPTRFKQ